MINQLPLDQIFVLLASFGLSLSAGVRAYLPLLAIGVASDFNIGDIHLRQGFTWIGDWPFMTLLVLLTIYEISADKIPVIDHLNDAVHTFIRPLSGALIFVSTNNLLTDHGTALAVVGALLGAGIAGTTHAAKAGVVRPASTVATMGLANPIVSLAEDIMAIGVTLVAILAPVVGAILFFLLALVVIRGFNTLIQRRRAKRIATMAQTKP